MNDERLKHTDPTLHGVVVALAVNVIILGKIEFVRFLFASAIALDQISPTLAQSPNSLTGRNKTQAAKALHRSGAGVFTFAVNPRSKLGERGGLAKF